MLTIDALLASVLRIYLGSIVDATAAGRGFGSVSGPRFPTIEGLNAIENGLKNHSI